MKTKNKILIAVSILTVTAVSVFVSSGNNFTGNLGRIVERNQTSANIEINAEPLSVSLAANSPSGFINLDHPENNDLIFVSLSAGFESVTIREIAFDLSDGANRTGVDDRSGNVDPNDFTEFLIYNTETEQRHGFVRTYINNEPDWMYSNERPHFNPATYAPTIQRGSRTTIGLRASFNNGDSYGPGETVRAAMKFRYTVGNNQAVHETGWVRGNTLTARGAYFIVTKNRAFSGSRTTAGTPRVKLASFMLTPVIPFNDMREIRFSNLDTVVQNWPRDAQFNSPRYLIENLYIEKETPAGGAPISNYANQLVDARNSTQAYVFRFWSLVSQIISQSTIFNIYGDINQYAPAGTYTLAIPKLGVSGDIYYSHTQKYVDGPSNAVELQQLVVR